MDMSTVLIVLLVLFVLGLDAPARAFMWIDTESIIVLDSAGHVELWSLRRS